jgi:hypothetical protein
MPSLLRFSASDRQEMFTCGEPNYNPCALSVYDKGG